MNNITLTNNYKHLNINYMFINPTGSIICFGGLTPPPGWLTCDGSEVSKDTYSNLYEVIGNNYGIPVNNNNFILPNLQNKFPLGKSNTNNIGNIGGNQNISLTVDQLPAHVHNGSTETAGNHNHSANIQESGSHTHGINDPGHTHTQTTNQDDYNEYGGAPPSFADDAGTTTTWNNINSSTTGISIQNSGSHNHVIEIYNNGNHNHDFITNSTGSGQEINIINPYIVLNYIIKY